MKYIILIILAVMILAVLTLRIILILPEDLNTAPDPAIYYEAGIKIIDRRFTPPNTYELLYRTTFENGLSVEQWREVTEEEFTQLEEDDG